MKKIYRKSQKKDVLGHRIGGLAMHKYGMPYRNAAGFVFASDLDLVDQMLDAVQKHTEIHIVTKLKSGWVVNRHEVEDATLYYLYTGNADPDIEFNTQFSMDDFTEEELAESERLNEEFRNHVLTPTEIAAINYSLHLWLNRASK